MSVLMGRGAALAGRKQFAEAEPLLVQGYEGMKQHQAKIPAANKHCLTDSLERLVELYEATGRRDRAAVLRKDLEQIQGTSSAP